MKGRQSRGLAAIYVSAVTLAGFLLIAVSVWRLSTATVSAGWYVLVALTIISSSATLRMSAVPVSFSVSDVFTMTAALLFGPAAGTVAVAVDCLVISLRLARRELLWRRALFNATAPALAMWVAAHIFFRLAGVGPLAEHPGAIGDVLGALAAFAAVYFILNTGLIAAAVAWEQAAPVFVVWRQHFLGLWMTFFGGASIAALMMLLLDRGTKDYGVIALVLPLPLILYVTFKRAVDRVQEQLDDLAKVNRLYHSLIEGAAYGIGRLALDGRFIDVNPALASMLGYTCDDLLGRNLWTDVVADPTARCSLSPESSASRIDGLEMAWRRKDGGDVDVRVSGRLVRTAEDDDPSFEMMVEDVTERRALEAQLRQSQRLDALGRLARGVAHDFNNLLTVIVGSGDLIAADLAPDHPAQSELRELLNAASTAASLTQQLVTFSRQQPCRPSEVDVNAVITNMRGLLQRLVGRPVALVFALSRTLPPIQADPGQIEQVIMNLAINARDAMPKGGTLTIATDLSPDAVLIRIADTGVGMSEDVRSHMFEPFFTTKPIGQGSGLGLATVYGIVKQNGGEISVASEINRGTTITVSLPAIAAAIS